MRTSEVRRASRQEIAICFYLRPLGLIAMYSRRCAGVSVAPKMHPYTSVAVLSKVRLLRQDGDLP